MDQQISLRQNQTSASNPTIDGQSHKGIRDKLQNKVN